jgi:hypothetical protein
VPRQLLLLLARMAILFALFAAFLAIGGAQLVASWVAQFYRPG